jgi:hypothetical protein
MEVFIFILIYNGNSQIQIEQQKDFFVENSYLLRSWIVFCRWIKNENQKGTGTSRI